MKKILLGFAVIIAVIFAMIGCETAPENTVAKVGKYNISVEELNDAIAPMASRFKTAQEDYDARMAAVENMIQQKLMLLGAYEKGLDKDSMVVERVKGGEDRRLLMALWKVEVEGKINVTEKEMRELYDKMSSEFRASHILVTDSTQAVELHKQLTEGADFAELAKEHSKDPGSATKGGDLSWFTPGRMVKPFDDAVQALEDGELSQPVKTRYGWHIIKRTGTRQKKQEPYEEVKENLKKTLENEKQQEKGQEVVEGIFEKTNFKVNEDAVEVIVEKYNASLSADEEENPAANAEMVFTDDEKAMTLATWDGGQWTINSFDSVLTQIPAFRRPELNSIEAVSNLVKGVMQSDLLLKYAQNIGITQTEEYKELYDSAIEDMMVNIFQNKNLYEEIEVGDPEIDEYYAANKDSFMTPRTIVVREVQVADEAAANAISDQVKGGQDIEGIVQEKSMRTYTKNKGGLLEITEMRFPKLYAAAGAATADQVIGPVQDRTGRWSVMKVIEVRESTPKEIDDVKEQIRAKLRREKRTQAKEDFMTKARTDYNVKVYEDVVAASVDSAKYEAPKEPIQSE